MLIKLHVLVSLLSSLLILISNRELALSCALGSMAFNLYLRFLHGGFKLLSLSPESSPRLRRIVSIFSGLRSAIIALVLTFLIYRFELNLIGIVIAFLLYIVVLLAFGFYTNRKP